jgi:hypothetical protein
LKRKTLVNIDPDNLLISWISGKLIRLEELEEGRNMFVGDLEKQRN